MSDADKINDIRRYYTPVHWGRCTSLLQAKNETAAGKVRYIIYFVRLQVMYMPIKL
jgi:hypothetical protein